MSKKESRLSSPTLKWKLAQGPISSTLLAPTISIYGFIARTFKNDDYGSGRPWYRRFEKGPVSTSL